MIIESYEERNCVKNSVGIWADRIDWWMQVRDFCLLKRGIETNKRMKGFNYTEAITVP